MQRKRAESKSSKKSAKDQFNDVLSKNPAAVEEIIYQYIDMMQIHYDEGDPERRKAKVMDAIQPIFHQMFGNDISIKNLGGENNLNLLVAYKGEEFVIQIGTQREPSLTAVDQLGKVRENKWVAQRYAVHVFANDAGNRKSETLKEMTLDASTKPIGFMTLVEKLGSSLSKELKKSQDEKPKVMFDSTKEIEFAKTVGLQLREIFLSLQDKNMIWTDCKPGNLLARENSDGSFQIVVADTKAILPADQLPIGIRSKTMNCTGLMTESYMSTQGFDKLASAVNPTAADVLKIMEKEYSYQMAVILYYSATGKEIFSKGEAKDTTFDFSHPMFKTEQGQRLELIIKELSKPNPDERMDYNTAARLMAVMDNKQAFEAVMRKFHAPGFSDPALHAPAQTSTTGTANIMVALAAAREPDLSATTGPRSEARNEAAKMLRRATSRSAIVRKPAVSDMATVSTEKKTSVEASAKLTQAQGQTQGVTSDDAKPSSLSPGRSQ